MRLLRNGYPILPQRPRHRNTPLPEAELSSVKNGKISHGLVSAPAVHLTDPPFFFGVLLLQHPLCGAHNYRRRKTGIRSRSGNSAHLPSNRPPVLLPRSIPGVRRYSFRIVRRACLYTYPRGTVVTNINTNTQEIAQSRFVLTPSAARESLKYSIPGPCIYTAIRYLTCSAEPPPIVQRSRDTRTN